MRIFDTSVRHSNSLVFAAVVLISVGATLIAFELGGIALAALFNALCLGVAVRYLIDEPARVKSEVRVRTLALQDMAYRDGLTGLPNRRFFHWYLERFLPRQPNRKNGEVLNAHVVLFDLNGFKAINDTYGHDAGDELLKLISDTMTQQLPSDVLLARLGGDEFVVLVRDQQQGRKLQRVLQTIRKSAKTTLVYDRQRIQVSASIGVSSSYRRRLDVNEMLREADRHMYHDKASQRDSKQSSPMAKLLKMKLEV